MAAKDRSDRDRFAAKPQAVAEDLLEPILQFLQQAGISEPEASAAFRSAWKRSSKQKAAAAVRLESLENPQPFVNLIGAWSRNPAYLRQDGSTRDLTMRGRHGFAALVRQHAPSMEPKRALSLLRSFGNVEQLRDGKIRLTKPFFHIKSDRKLAFEPSINFLLDAARNVRASLAASNGRTVNSKGAQHFWRAVDANNIPDAKRKEFLIFIKSLSLTFLQDVDDWLSENESTAGSTNRSGRLGLGLFTIGVAPE